MDILELNPHQEPSRIIVRIEKPDDLNHLVVRSSYASIRMPELNVTITPGPYAQGIITTIEGFLHRAKEIAEFLFSCDLNEEQRRDCLQTLEKIEAAINGNMAFTFMIEDPSGLSVIIPKEGVTTKIIKEPLKTKDIDINV